MSSVDKIIYKVLANRLKVELEKATSRSLNYFTKGRQILDSILIANECLASIIRSGVPRCFVN